MRWKHLRGHNLSNPIRTMGAYTARCACGVDVWGPTLPGHLRPPRRAPGRSASAPNYSEGGSRELP